MLALVLILLPLFAGLLLFFVKGENVKKLALLLTLAELVISLAAFYQLKNNAGSELLRFNKMWIASLGINFSGTLDGLSMLMVLLTTVLMPLIVASGLSKEQLNPSALYGLMLIMQSGLVGVFTASDGFLFYVFWELALIPVYFICLLWGGENRAKITFKFFLYTMVGSLLMLIALIYLYLHTNAENPLLSRSFNIEALYKSGAALSSAKQGLVFWGIFMAFAIKMPVFPFHTWQPDTYTVAPTQGTMLLSGIMLKMGTYGAIRWLLPVVPLGVQQWSGAVIVLSVIGIIYASLLAITQKDFKRLIAYSSISHVGLIAAGIFSLNVQGVQGAVIQMLAHGVNVIGLFFIAEIISNRMHTGTMNELGGIRNIEPRFAWIFLIVLLGSVALPLTNGFIGEFLLINGIYQYSAWTALFAGLTVILGAVYMLRSYQHVMLGETNALTKTFAALTKNELWVLLPIVALIIIFGIYPKPILEMAEPVVKNILNIAGIK